MARVRDNEKMDDSILTEVDAARAWALAYNTHDPSVLAPILSADVRVMSRWVVNDLVGRDAYVDYLTRKFATFERAGSVVRVELAAAPVGSSGLPGRPCALMEQDGSLLATVFFDVIGGRLFQISLGANPPPATCRRSGDYPGFETQVGVVN